jgi:hypothetical protein
MRYFFALLLGLPDDASKKRFPTHRKSPPQQGPLSNYRES